MAEQNEWQAPPCDLGWSLTVLMQRYETLTEHIFAEVPRGARGYQVLYTVVFKEPQTQHEIAEYLGIDRTVLTYIIGDLVKAGLLERQPSPEDKRVRIMTVTDLGLQVVTRMRQELDTAEQELLEALTPTESMFTRALLSELANRWK